MKKQSHHKPTVKKNLHKSILAALSLTGATSLIPAHAALTSSAVLAFDPGVVSCVNNDCVNSGTNVTAGSYFGMDANGDGVLQNSEKTPISMHNGIHIGFVSAASGSHSGLPFGAANNYAGTNLIQIGVTTDHKPIFQSNGSGVLVTQTSTEHPGVDEPWGFFGNTGMDYLTKAVTVVNDAGSKKFLDFSGWTVTWNGIPAIPMSSGAWSTGTNFFGGGNGVAKIACSASSCSGTSTFTLDYFATVAIYDPSGFGGVNYTLHLVGHVVDAVPVPAAAWLFGSGLMGLAAVARRKKKA
jgi:hypothetical protein